MKNYIPKKKSNAKKFDDLVEHGQKLGNKSERWSEFDLDDFVFVCWAKRGYVGEKSTQDIVRLYLNGTNKLIDFSKRKVMGWGHMAKLATYSKQTQNKFVKWYKSFERMSHIETAASQGVKNANKVVLNRYFERNNIDITIS